jgi:hypothetical protein
VVFSGFCPPPKNWRPRYEILLKVALNTITLSLWKLRLCSSYLYDWTIGCCLMVNEAYFSHNHEKNNLPSIHHSEIQMAIGGACGRMFCHKENGKGSDILPRNLSPMSTRYLSALLNTFTYKKLNILNTRGKQRSSTSRTKGELWALSTPSQPVDANFGGGDYIYIFTHGSRRSICMSYFLTHLILLTSPNVR